MQHAARSLSLIRKVRGQVRCMSSQEKEFLYVLVRNENSAELGLRGGTEKDDYNLQEEAQRQIKKVWQRIHGH